MRIPRRPRRTPPVGRRVPPSERETVVERPTTAVERPATAVQEEQYVAPRRPRPPLIWPWVLLLLLLVVGGLLAAYFLTRDNGHSKRRAGPARVIVPDVIGLQQAEAVRRVNAQHLTPTLQSSVSTKPKGTVFAEAPGAGTQVTRASVVTLSVSAASVRAVPNVVGQTTVSATAQLKVAGFQTSVTTVSSRAPASTVIAQSPSAGTRLGKGSTVALRVSQGLASVPNVVGQKRADAEAALKGAGFQPNVFTVPGAQPRGTVTAQNPTGGTRASKGSKVRVNVSNGSAATTVPSTGPTGSAGSPPPPPSSAAVKVPKLVGASATFAQRRLADSGLKARVVYVNSSQTAGQVISQTPAANTSVKRGTRVQLSVSAGPNAGAFQPVPDVTGNDQQTATSTLQGAGFKVYMIEQKVTDQSQAGTIVDEQPAAGSQAPRGATVTIYVGRFGG